MEKQVKKFGFYGLLKNLRFFEPFLLLFFIENGLSFIEIGFLYSIRETIIYVFEIPSGVFADRFGKKNELMICFIMYIFSFIGFFFAHDFIMLAIAMIFFGFGEALRSGTHKAMIMEYLDVNNIKSKKSKVYGFTRSYSNLGSSISSIVGIILVLLTPNIRYLFLFAIIPYIADTLLIMTYPQYLNTKQDTVFHFKQFIKENILSVVYVFKNKQLANNIIESSGFTAIYKTVKDYIQPLLIALGVVVLFGKLSIADNEKIYLGIIYAMAEFISVFVSLNAYKLENKFNSKRILQLTWYIASFTLIIMGIWSGNLVVIVLSFILFYVYQNIRKPFMVEKIGDASHATKRASVLSIESQITSLFVILFAPILGLIADRYSIGTMLVSIGIFMVLIGILKNQFLTKKQKNE
jgi:MFS family permease